MKHLGNITPEFLSKIKFPDGDGSTLNYLMVIPYKLTNKYAFPAGLGIVTASLKASGRNVYTLNLDLYDNPLNILEHEIGKNHIDVVMTGGFSVEYNELYSIIYKVKQINSSIVTVVGGGIISADPITAMEALEYADYGMIGEGEITVNELAYVIEHQSDATLLPGIIFKKNNEWIVNEDFPEMKNLDIIPYPDYQGFEYGKILYGDSFTNKWTKRAGSNKIIYLNITRSCPFLCTFCFHTCGNHYRRMSMDGIFKFLDWIIQQYPEVEALSIDGELTFATEKYAMEFCERIKPYNLKWRANTRVDVITEKMLRIMKESGCTSIMFGIESACDEILKSMKKRITVKQVEHAFEIANTVGIYARGTLIFGDPKETADTVRTTIEWYLKNRKWSDIDNFWNITLGLIKAYPGTELYRMACDSGMIQDKIKFLKDGCPPMNLSQLSNKEYDLLPKLFVELYKKDFDMHSFDLIMKGVSCDTKK